MGNNCQCSIVQRRNQIENEILDEPIVNTEAVNQFSQIDNMQKQTQQDPIEEKKINSQSYNKANSIMISGQPKPKQSKRVRIMLHVDDSQKVQCNDNVCILTTKIKQQDYEDILNSLNRHFILSQLKQQEQRQIIKEMEYCTTQSNSYIFKKGDQSFSFYIILSGKCLVQVCQQQKKQIGFGQSFGDLGILYNAPRSASILSIEDCLLVRLNRSTFKQTLNKLSQKTQRQNKRTLKTLQFYKHLTDIQKNTLAANCITQVYHQNQTIFNKGDDSNSFYIICKGEIKILDKNLILGKGQYFGLNSILEGQTTVRTSTLIANTKCTLLSITKQAVKKNLGDHITSIIRKNLALKLIKQSCLKKILKVQSIKQSINDIKFEKINKLDIVFRKDRKVEKGIIYILLNTQIKAQKSYYCANSLIQAQKVFKGEQIIFKQDFIAEKDGYLGVACISKSKGQLNIKNYKTSTHENYIKLDLKDFIVLRKLQSGNFGQIYATYNLKNNKKYAIKVMDKIFMEQKKYSKFLQRQCQILTVMKSHPFILDYYDTFDNGSIVALVVQLIEGQDLYDALSTKTPINEKQVRFYIAQILLMIQHLHTQNIVYRDLKPQNIMLTIDGYLKLIDLGTAKQLTIQDRFKTKTIIGTPHYMAPQTITGKGYSFSTDLWGIGVIMYEMLHGYLPFGQNIDDPYKIYQQTSSKPYKIKKNSLQPQTLSLLKRLLSKTPQKREGNGINQIMQYDFFEVIQWKSLLLKQLPAFRRPSQKRQISFDQITKCISKNRTALKIFVSDQQKKRNSK